MERRLNAEQLAGLTSGPSAATLDSMYVVSGDEPLLITEALDALRAAAGRSGYGERVSLTLDARGDWSSLISATQNISLFGDRRLVDLHIPSGKPGKTGGETLIKLADMVTSGALIDTVVLVHLPRLDKAGRTAKWAQALFEVATSVEIANVERAQLPQWIKQRLARQKQQLDVETLEWMADKVEGNLLAAFQEIQKLGLLYPAGKIDGADVRRAVLNVARYDVFGLRDAMLNAQGAKALTMLNGLRAEGEALPLVLWSIGEEIRVLARLSQAQAAGQDLQAEMRRQRVFGAREQLLRQTLARVPAAAWPPAVQHAHDIDRLIKGLSVPGRLSDPWEELGRLALRIAQAKRPARRP